MQKANASSRGSQSCSGDRRGHDRAGRRGTAPMGACRGPAVRGSIQATPHMPAPSSWLDRLVSATASDWAAMPEGLFHNNDNLMNAVIIARKVQDQGRSG